MKLPFRQGIVRYQTDSMSNPTFLVKASGGSKISLVASPDPTILSFAHGTENYLFEEKQTVNNAWTGFVANTDYWLYWDIDLITGNRTFGSTIVEPLYGPTAPIPPVLNDRHWFDTSKHEMKVWNGIAWVNKLRLFACKYDEGSIIQPYPYGTQVNSQASNYSGFMLFDDEDKPVRKNDKRGQGKFLTTESVFSTHSSKMVNVAFETVVLAATATENIPAYSLVYLSGPEEMRLSSHLDIANSVAGLVQEDFFMGEIGSYTVQGFVTNEQWNWTVPPQTPLFCGVTGELVTTVPQNGVIQQVGKVISSQRIFLDIQPPIVLDDA